MIQKVRGIAAREHNNPEYYFIRSHTERYSVTNWHADWKVHDPLGMAAVDHKDPRSWQYYVSRAKKATGAVQQLRDRLWAEGGGSAGVRGALGLKCT